VARTGRPSKIHDVVNVRDDGTRVTVADRIVAALRAGNYLEPSAQAVGVAKTTVYEWIKLGGAAQRRITNDGVNRSALSQHERRCLDFADAVADAQAEWEVDANARLQRLAVGDHTVVTVTEKVNADGELLERTTKTERLAPSAQVLEWRLTRRFPDRYSQRVEVSGPEGAAIPVEVRARNLADALRQHQAGELTEATP
jgi:hypothetical protein